MKKLLPILLVLTFLSSACQLGGAPVQPTPITLPTALPTNTPIALIPTSAPVSGNVAAGTSRTSPDGMTEVFIPQGSVQMGGIDPAASADEKRSLLAIMDEIIVKLGYPEHKTNNASLVFKRIIQRAFISEREAHTLKGTLRRINLRTKEK